MTSTAITQATSASVSEFLAAIDDNDRRRDCKTLVRMMRAATGAKAKMWGPTIVGFDSYRYRYSSGHDGAWPVIAFSPRKGTLTLYIMSGFTAHDTLVKQLGKVKTGKSCLYVRSLEDLDLDVLRQLIEASVKWMRVKYPVVK